MISVPSPTSCRCSASRLSCRKGYVRWSSRSSASAYREVARRDCLDEPHELPISNGALGAMIGVLSTKRSPTTSYDGTAVSLSPSMMVTSPPVGVVTEAAKGLSWVTVPWWHNSPSGRRRLGDRLCQANDRCRNRSIEMPESKHRSSPRCSSGPRNP